MEEWKRFRDFNYLVSIFGKVKTIPHVVIRSDGKTYSAKEKILKPATDGNGYLRFAINVNKKLTTFKLHRVVCEVFNGTSKLEVNHIDGDKKNNCSSNLEWVSRSENVKHAFDIGLAKPMRGEANPSSKITEGQALKIISMLYNGIGPIEISKQLNISKNITKDISRGKTWKHLSRPLSK